MGLLPLDFYSLTQAVDFINQKTNSTIKENLLYSYAMEGKIRFLLNIEIKDNQLVKIGRMDAEGFFLYEDSEVHFKEEVIEYEVQNILHLEDKLSKMEITSDEIFEDKGGLFLSYNKENKINEYKGYIVLHPELLDVFCKESLPQHSLRNTNYLILDEFNVQNPSEADIFNSFNFTMKYPKYNEDEQLYMKHTFRINFSDIKIPYDDLIKLTPSVHPLRCDDLETKIEKLTKEIEEKDKVISELQSVLDGENYPIFLNKFMENDRLALAVKARKDYWANYDQNLNNAPKAEPTAREIKEKYGLSQKQAEAIEIIACPINRN